jgi:PAS domain S-box-containing protein
MMARLRGMTAALAVGIVLAVAAACTAGAYLYSRRHYERLLDGARATALAQAELIRTALEHEMLTQDRTLIARMVRSFGSEPDVTGVMLLDRTGVVRYTSGAAPTGSGLDLQGPTCQACHQFPPAQRSSSRVIESGGRSILRTVVPVRNRPECHACHDPAQRINGIVIFDVDASRIQSTAAADLRWMVGTTGIVALLLLAGIGAEARFLVLRRLGRVESSARQSAGERERIETIINSIDDGIVVLDGRRTVIAANDAFLTRSGLGRRDLVGCSCAAAGQAMCGMTDCPTLACLESGARQVRIGQRRRADGTTAWEEVHACRIEAAPGEDVQIVEVWRDISERRAAEARLAESHRLASLGLLASGFSHEMNTPLGTVMTCVDGIGRELRPDGRMDLTRVREHATIAREQLLRCRAITQHFLRVSRGERSGGAIVDVGSVLAAVVRLVEPTARAHGIAIDAGDPAASPLPVQADEADLQQAFINVLLNGVQASTEGGTVRIRIESRDPITIAVEDQGCGIAPDQQARIFEPFFSLRHGGTGLGLFVSLDAVRKWGGDIRVASTPGAGATFTFVLPAVALPIRQAAI